MKLYRWSDGSMSLHLGNEIFDIHKQPLAGDHNHMFIRQVIVEKRIIKILSLIFFFRSGIEVTIVFLSFK